ncbi:small conductance mechanosensitive channel [Luteibacter sp. UNCMF331Sha3.1]|jgi:small conductance mechanosensitive channel|uniref:mechanosensitive ion channel family protein n=1 Tax=Luteibacter sp. UNCMF331Sha3.1 TaxID=1502760 RepID=UPI0008C66570|nr:mechanosensitive ion channel domain-containing protein [Luteibacter sp. UNCMF331Sha3.1]SEM78591.1 small conductance mechanosensitive channel [Luteibacter sp. UNCMF331Sha3.1]
MTDFLDRLGIDHAMRVLIITYSIRIGLALLLLLVGFWIAARLANFGRRALERARVDVTLAGFLRNIIYGILIALLMIQVLGMAGVPTASFIAAIGAAGLAIGLALNSSLSNLAWGVLLILFRPFRVGDFVTVGGVDGTVESVNLMHTYLITPDNRQAVVPNAKVGGDAIINYNVRGTRRFELKVGIGYGDDIGKAMQVVRDLFAADPRILKDPAPGVWTEALGDSSVNLVIRGWTATGDMWETQTSLLRGIKERFDENGITIPYPQSEIRVVGPTAEAQPNPLQPRA